MFTHVHAYALFIFDGREMSSAGQIRPQLLLQKGAVLLCPDNTDSKTENDTTERYAPMCARVCVCEIRACPPFILRSATVKRTFGPAFVTARNSELCTPPDNGCYLRLRAQLSLTGVLWIPRAESKNAYSNVVRQVNRKRPKTNISYFI